MIHDSGSSPSRGLVRQTTSSLLGGGKGLLWQTLALVRNFLTSLKKPLLRDVKTAVRLNVKYWFGDLA